MKTESLRRGNLVQTNQGVYKVHLIGEKHIEVCPFLEKEPFEVKIWEPIPLTEEWLKRVSMYSTYGSQKWIPLTKLNAEIHFEIFTRELHGTEIVTTLYSKFGTLILEPIKYVHELQNLYFVLSAGEELTLKQ